VKARGTAATPSCTGIYLLNGDDGIEPVEHLEGKGSVGARRKLLEMGFDCSLWGGGGVIVWGWRYIYVCGYVYLDNTEGVILLQAIEQTKNDKIQARIRT
jgi:hypothetical protein